MGFPTRSKIRPSKTGNFVVVPLDGWVDLFRFEFIAISPFSLVRLRVLGRTFLFRTFLFQSLQFRVTFTYNKRTDAKKRLFMGFKPELIHRNKLGWIKLSCRLNFRFLCKVSIRVDRKIFFSNLENMEKWEPAYTKKGKTRKHLFSFVPLSSLLQIFRWNGIHSKVGSLIE